MPLSLPGMSAAHVKLTLHPLPDCLSFLSGHVGLEPAFLRGIVRLEYATSSRFSLFANPLPLHIKQLLIVLTCRQTASFLYRYDLELTRRERLLWRDECLLLHSGETVHAGTLLEIPFEIAIPEPVDLVPVIPPSFQIQNYERY